MKIKQLSKVNNPRQCYKFDIEFMFGDADYYQHEIIIVDMSDPYLERFIKFLNNSVRFRIDDNKKPIDYDLFCDEEIADEAGIFFWWPCDEYQHARMQKYKVTFFDGYGTEYNVEIKE